MRTVPRPPFEWWLRRGSGTLFDALHGVDTNADGGTEPLEIVSSNLSKVIAYDPAPWPTLRRAMQFGGLDARGFVFVDVGCGKGKVVLSAMAFAFERIIGVEHSRTLCRIAERNADNARLIGRRCSRVEIVCADAATYRAPDEPTVFFFYNPFTFDIMQTVLQNIVDAHMRSPAARYLIFYATSTLMPNICAFLRSREADWARLIASGRLGKHSLNIVAFSDVPIPA